jgi:hypothetical protein
MAFQRNGVRGWLEASEKAKTLSSSKKALHSYGPARDGNQGQALALPGHAVMACTPRHPQGVKIG